MNKVQELAIASQLRKIISSIGEAVEYDDKRMSGKISYAQTGTQRREWGLVPSLLLTMSGLIQSPIEFGKNASELNTLRAKASSVAGLDELVPSEISMVKGRHSLLSSEQVILDAIEPEFEDTYELLEIALKNLVKAKKIDIPKRTSLKLKRYNNSTKWQTFEAKAQKQALEAYQEIKSDLEAHKAQMKALGIK